MEFLAEVKIGVSNVRRERFYLYFSSYRFDLRLFALGIILFNYRSVFHYIVYNMITDMIIIISVIILRNKITHHHFYKSAKHVINCFCQMSVIPGYIKHSFETMNGMIWSKTQKSFVPISSVPSFAIMQQERLRQSRALETYNFQLQNLTLTSFQEQHFFEFYDNDTKVTGLCGELWTLLSEKLNFTLQSIRSNEISVGVLEKNQTTFTHGLLGIISRNETFAIPKIETYNARLIATDFTIPLWINSQRLYIKKEIIHDRTWMAEVFSWKIWCFILVMHLLLSVCSFLSQIVFSRIGNNNCKRSTISDHIFYNFGMLCNQSYIPNVLIGRSRIIELFLGLFCSMLYMSFGALLYIYIAKRINIVAPFYNLDSLYSSKYDIISLNGSLTDIAFQVIDDDIYVRIRTEKLVIAPTIDEMFKLLCKKDKKYTIFQGEDDYKARSQSGCPMIPVGEPYFKMWVASGIVKKFKYKRTIDLGILKLKEVGLWNALTNRWLTEEHQNYNNILKVEAIEIDQVSLIILIMCCGMIIAFIIFIIEKVVYVCKHKS